MLVSKAIGAVDHAGRRGRSGTRHRGVRLAAARLGLLSICLVLSLLIAVPAFAGTLFFDDFESGGWATKGAGGAAWQGSFGTPDTNWWISSVRAAGGSNSAHPQSNPPNQPYKFTAMILGPFDLQSTSEPYLEFDIWHDLQPGSHRLYLSLDTQGMAVEGLEVVGGYSGSSGGWKHQTIDLSNVPVYDSRQEIQWLDLTKEPRQFFQFIYDTPSGIQPSGEGVWLDNVGVIDGQSGPDTRLTLSAPGVSAYRSAKLKGTLTSTDSSGIVRKLAGRPVSIQKYSSGKWTTIAKVKTSSTGSYSYKAHPKTKTRYRARFGGSSTWPADTSASRSVKPKVSVTRPSLGTTTLRRGRSYTARGYLKPRHKKGSRCVKIAAYRYSNGKYRYVRSYSAKARNYSSYTRYSGSIKLPTRGKWRLRVVHGSDSKNAKTYSSWRYVRVR